MNLEKELIQQSNDEEDNTIQVNDSPFTLSLRIKCFYAESDFIKFIKNTERLIRSSLEYKQWIRYLVENLGKNACSLTKELSSECSIEIHHHPINLFTICKAVISDKLNKGLSFCTFDICKDVIELHFQNKVGCMPLLSDLHAKYHNGYLNLPIDHVSGNWKHIIETYPVDDDERERIMGLATITTEECNMTWGKDMYPGSSDKKKDSTSVLPPKPEIKMITETGKVVGTLPY
jgi:hypothetical protein